MYTTLGLQPESATRLHRDQGFTVSCLVIAGKKCKERQVKNRGASQVTSSRTPAPSPFSIRPSSKSSPLSQCDQLLSVFHMKHWALSGLGDRILLSINCYLFMSPTEIRKPSRLAFKLPHLSTSVPQFDRQILIDHKIIWKPCGSFK